jgi:phospholipid/cholesterol/gamma-HCH transport system substrate-binding protein
MVTQAPKRSAIAIAVAFSLSCIGLIIFVWTQFGGSIPFAAGGYSVKALFPETGLLVSGADVRISGVTVGRVTNVQARGVSSLVSMEIDHQYAPIPTDTRAILREKTLLGEAFVMLSWGNRAGPKLRDGATIPRGQVQPNYQLDQVLDAFNTQTQHNLQRVLIGTGSALSGRGEDLNDAIGNLGPAAGELSAIVGVLNDQSQNLRSLIAGGASVLQTLGARAGELQTLINAGNRVFASTSANAAALRGTVNGLTPFLSQLRSTLHALKGTVKLAAGPVHQIRLDEPLVAPALRELAAGSRPAASLLRAAPPVLRAGVAALPAIASFAGQLRPTLDAILPATQQIVPMIDFIKGYKEELVAAMANLAATLQGTVTPGGSDRYIPALLTLGSDSLFGAQSRDPTIRNNTYPSPGELASISGGELLAASCANTRNPSQTLLPFPNVPCKQQPAFDWGHGVAPSYYPHLTAAPK